MKKMKKMKNLINSSAVANNYAKELSLAQESGELNWDELKAMQQTSEKLHDIAKDGKQYTKANFPIKSAL